MAEITAAAVKALREKTGLPMMDCKKALTEAGGDMELAIVKLREAGAKVAEKRSGRATTAGRIAVFSDIAGKIGAMVDLRCESAPVSNNEEFVQLADNLVSQLAKGPGAATPDALLAQPSPGKPGQTLKVQLDDLFNRIREVFKVERIVRIDAACGSYAHHNGAVGVLLEVEGGNLEVARDICMHIAAMRPLVLLRTELDPGIVAEEMRLQEELFAKENEAIVVEANRLLSLPDEQMQDPNNLQRQVSSHARANNELRRAEGVKKNKAKVIDGRMGLFYGERCLLEQLHANQAKYGKKTVADVAKEAGMKIARFVHWELPKE
ncbi:MAG: translation elongation factor Ts [Pirellulales bacterium]|nr:translation elongation factor Ts [Pirellulales bacterium]